MALLAAAPVAAELDDDFQPATDAGAGAASLHGSQLAWVGADGAIHLSDLANGTRRPLTFLPAGSLVQSLDFDGRWIAWSDNRFGGFEAFALDIERLTLVRLHPGSPDAVDITVGGGHAAWLEGAFLYGTDLASPAARRLSQLPGLSFTPSLEGDTLVWSQLLGTERRLAGLHWGGNATLLTAGPHVLDIEPVTSNGHVVWHSQVRTGPADDRAARSLGSNIRVAALKVGLLQPQNLTELGMSVEPVAGGSWAGWLKEDAPAVLVLRNLATNATYQLDDPAGHVLVSDTHLVLVPEDGSPLVARPWSAPGSRTAGAAPLLFVAVALAAVAALARRR